MNITPDAVASGLAAIAALGAAWFWLKASIEDAGLPGASAEPVQAYWNLLAASAASVAVILQAVAVLMPGSG